MTGSTICLTGTPRQSDAQSLQGKALEQLAAGALHIEAKALDAIEFGPVQVLICAAEEARRRGIPCTLDVSAEPAINRCLAALHLPDAAWFFSILPSTEVSP